MIISLVCHGIRNVRMCRRSRLDFSPKLLLAIGTLAWRNMTDLVAWLLDCLTIKNYSWITKCLHSDCHGKELQLISPNRGVLHPPWHLVHPWLVEQEVLAFRGTTDAESAAVYVTCPSTNILSTSLQLQNTCNHQRNHWSHDRYFHNVFIFCGIDLVIFFKALHRFLETFNWRWTLCQETRQKGTGYWECWPTCCLFCGGLWTSWHMFQGILDFAGKYVGHFAKKQAWNNPSSLLLEKAKCQTLKWTALRTYVN